MKILLPFSVVAIFAVIPAFAENIPTTDPGCTSTVLGAANIANRSAALEPDFHANTINTTWYSNGEQLTGNNIPGTCTYDAALTPPTPDNRPGYTFAGWKIRAALATRINTANAPTAYALKRYNGEDYVFGNTTVAAYGITEPGQYGLTFSEGNVTGQALCSNTSDVYGVAGTPNENCTGSSCRYCWCKVTGFTPTNGTSTSLSSTPWVIFWGYTNTTGCNASCTGTCADYLYRYSDYRDTLFDLTML